MPSLTELLRLQKLGYGLYGDVTFGRLTPQHTPQELWQLKAVLGLREVILWQKATWEEYCFTVKAWMSLRQESQERRAA